MARIILRFKHHSDMGSALVIEIHYENIDRIEQMNMLHQPPQGLEYFSKCDPGTFPRLFSK